jgi:hypothetical protein
MTTTTGTMVLQQAVHARGKSQNLGYLARDLGVSAEALYAFGQGQGTLPDDVLAALTKEMFHGHASYDPAINKLRPAVKQVAQPLGIAPAPVQPQPNKFKGGPPPAQPGYGGAPAAKPPRLPGWAD